MIISKEVEVKWHPKNKKYFEKKGYIFTKWKDAFLAKVEDLPDGSCSIIKIKCDYCNDIVENFYYSYVIKKNKSFIKKDCCPKCSPLKISESTMEQHGVKHPHQRKEVRDKYKQTIFKNYGVTCPFDNEEIVKEIKINNLDKFGFECPLSSKLVRKKIKHTFIEKYGTENVFGNKEIQEKINKTLMKNQTAPTSNQQKYLHKLLGGISNFTLNTCRLDICFPDEMIVCEYDGGGHNLSVKMGNITQKQFKTKERKRETFIKSQGYKLIRIISEKDNLPSDKIIIKLIKECKEYLNSGHSWIHINIDKSMMICSEFEKEIKLGKLRKIKKSDVSKSA